MRPQIPDLLQLSTDWIAVDKPAGLLSVPGRVAASSVLAWAGAAFGQAHAVHRLDQATSGVMVLALNKDAERHLAAQFRARTIAKRYVAVVHGGVQGHEGEIDVPLLADWSNRPKQKVDWEQGKPSLTRWRLLGRDDAQRTSRLALEPVTGRSHQLRVHLQVIGHPIVGDALYQEASAPRMLLHAAHLAFDDPKSGGRVLIDSPVPF